MENQTILLTERNGIHGKEIFYVKPKDQNLLISTSLKGSVRDNILYGIRNVFTEIFLPHGYPASVSNDYIDYQIWDTAQAFCSTVTGILATKAVMSGVGVGNIEATPLAATITWVLKDGTGHIGRIGFAWWKGTSLDADCKLWRLVADCLNDGALCLELALPMFSNYTTLVLCVSTAMKSIVGVAGGATRAALTQHHALRGNLGDVAAKDGSQETAVNLIASMVAIFIISICDENVWGLFFFFTIMHLIFNYLAIRSVCLTSFNKTRFVHLLNAYFKSGVVSTPKIINKEESVMFGNKITENTLSGYKIHIGHSLKDLVESKGISYDELENTIKLSGDRKYLMVANVKQNEIYIVFHEAATSEDVLKSYFHAIKLGLSLHINHKSTHDSKEYLNVSTNPDHACDCLDKNTNCTQFQIAGGLEIDEEWSNIRSKLVKTGWSMEKQFLLSQEWRGKW